MQECTRVGLSYGEMMEDQEGFFRRGEGMMFDCQDGQCSMAEEVTTLQAAADAWARWMRSEGHQVVELPRTARTHEWSLTYSVTAQGEESQVYVVAREA